MRLLIIVLNINATNMKDRENRTSDYVCCSCGVQYLTEEQKKEGGNVVTAHLGNCGLCGKEDTVIHIRYYNYLFKKEKQCQ